MSIKLEPTVEEEEFVKKVNHFIFIMKDISSDITKIFSENKEDVYRECLIKMLEALDESQKTVKKAYNLFLSRNITED